MEIKSLGRMTDLMFARFSGSVIDRGDYTLVQTPSNPGYHWGNYIIFNYAPRPGDLEKWRSIFLKEFSYYKTPNHFVFAWDTASPEQGVFDEFLKANFEFDTAVVLTAKEVNPPAKVNEDVVIRKIFSDKEWEAVIQNQTACADPQFLNEYYESFKRKQAAEYRKMSEAGYGYWFGAFVEDRLVGDLGIFYQGSIGRYQNVGTHPDFRRQGICGTLVYRTAQIAFEEFGVETLVMEADAEYHAARIYESVGFDRNETNHSLSWWKSKPES